MEWQDNKCKHGFTAQQTRWLPPVHNSIQCASRKHRPGLCVRNSSRVVLVWLNVTLKALKSHAHQRSLSLSVNQSAGSLYIKPPPLGITRKHTLHVPHRLRAANDIAAVPTTLKFDSSRSFSSRVPPTGSHTPRARAHRVPSSRC